MRSVASSSSDSSDAPKDLPLDATEPRLAPEVNMDGNSPNPNIEAVNNALAGDGDSEIQITGEKVVSADGVISKKRKVTLNSLLKKVTATPTATNKDLERDELEEYLSEPPIDDAEIDLLKWWSQREARWPKLTKMVKQFLAAPASTAGVERVFSAAGRMHTDLRKSMQDSTLEHSILAAFNNP